MKFNCTPCSESNLMWIFRSFHLSLFYYLHLYSIIQDFNLHSSSSCKTWLARITDFSPDASVSQRGRRMLLCTIPGPRRSGRIAISWARGAEANPNGVFSRARAAYYSSFTVWALAAKIAKSYITLVAIRCSQFRRCTTCLRHVYKVVRGCEFTLASCEASCDRRYWY